MIDLEQPQLIGELADWVVGMLVQQEPWQWASVEFKRAGEAFDARFEVLDAAGQRAFGGVVSPEFAQFGQLSRLQQACAGPETGSWLSGLVFAQGSEDGSYSRRAKFNYEQEIGRFFEDGPDFTAEDLVRNLTEFPRRADLVHPWMRQRIEAAGLRVPEA